MTSNLPMLISRRTLGYTRVSLVEKRINSLGRWSFRMGKLRRRYCAFYDKIWGNQADESRSSRLSSFSWLQSFRRKHHCTRYYKLVQKIQRRPRPATLTPARDPGIIFVACIWSIRTSRYAIQSLFLHSWNAVSWLSHDSYILLLKECRMLSWWQIPYSQCSL